MKDWLKVKSPEEEAKTGILPVGQPVVLYLCPRDYWKNQSKAWRGDIGSLRIETGAIPVWGSAIGDHSGFDGIRFADIRKDYDVCFTDVPPLDVEQCHSEGWLKAELGEGKETEIPVVGQSVVLCLCPRDRNQTRETDIGSLYIESGETDAIVWGSAFGLCSAFDGTEFKDILKDYEVYFTEVPPLELGRFPSPLGISLAQRETNYRAHIKRVLDDLK